MTCFIIIIHPHYVDSDANAGFETGPQCLWSALMAAFEEEDDYPMLHCASEAAEQSRLFLGIIDSAPGATPTTCCTARWAFDIVDDEVVVLGGGVVHVPKDAGLTWKDFDLQMP